MVTVYLLPVERLSIEPPSNGEAKELSGKPLWDGSGDGGLKHGTIKKDYIFIFQQIALN